jgi:hypothetical protein
MNKPLDEILGHVTLEQSLSEPLVVEGKKYKVLGCRPNHTIESIEIFRKSCVSMGDLFGLEPPRTYADLVYRKEHYKLEIVLGLEEI